MILLLQIYYGNTVIASGNEQKAEVLGSYFSGVFTKENNIPYDTTNIINADETLSHLNCQFGEEIILDKISQLNVCKSPGPDSFQPSTLEYYMSYGTGYVNHYT